MTGLDPSVKAADLALSAWGRWARGELSKHSWPRESPMFKIVRETVLGISAKVTATAGSELVAAYVLRVDRVLARLPRNQRRALRAHYLDRGQTRFHCAQRARMTLREYDRALAAGRRSIQLRLEA